MSRSERKHPYEILIRLLQFKNGRKVPATRNKFRKTVVSPSRLRQPGTGGMSYDESRGNHRFPGNLTPGQQQYEVL